MHVVRAKKIRQVNTVSIGMTLILAAAIYGGMKYIPVYYQAHEVENALDVVKVEAAKVNLFQDDPRADELIETATDAIRELGVDDRYLSVYFSDDMSEVRADYMVTVELLFGKIHEIQMEKVLVVPRADYL